MAFAIVVIVLLASGLWMAHKLSPWTERMMNRIWQDPTYSMQVKVARRVKELCVDGDVPAETATMMIARENNLIEEQVREMMRTTVANPAILRLAFGSRAGGIAAQVLKKYRLLGD